MPIPLLASNPADLISTGLIGQPFTYIFFGYGSGHEVCNLVYNYNTLVEVIIYLEPGITTT